MGMAGAGIGRAGLVLALGLSLGPAARAGAPAGMAERVATAAIRARLMYDALHALAEPAGQERRTAAVVAADLSAAGFTVTTGIGGHGVVGRLDRGPGPVVALRAELDALPMDDGVEHACGHDLHLAAMLGAARLLAAGEPAWRGTLLAIGQPAEEPGTGAAAMVADRLWERFPRPGSLLAQHAAPDPAGTISHGPADPQADRTGLRIRFLGRGGHGAGDGALDPIPLAAELVLAVETLARREAAALTPARLRVGRVAAGRVANVVPGAVELEVDLRSFGAAIRRRLVGGVGELARGIAARVGAGVEVETTLEVPGLQNDPELAGRVAAAQRAWLGEGRVGETRAIFATDDVSLLGLPPTRLCYWYLGTAGPAGPRGSLHAPGYAPDLARALPTGIEALVAAALALLAAP